MKKGMLRGTFKVESGYSVKDMIMSDEAIYFMHKNFERVPVYWKGLSIEAAKDGELVNKKIVAGKVLGSDVMINNNKKVEISYDIELDTELAYMLSRNEIDFDPLFRVTEAKRIGDATIICDAKLIEISLVKRKSVKQS